MVIINLQNHAENFQIIIILLPILNIFRQYEFILIKQYVDMIITIILYNIDQIICYKIKYLRLKYKYIKMYQ